MKIGVRIIAARDTMTTMANLATEIEESTFEVIGYGMDSQSATLSRNKLRRANAPFPLGQLIARFKLMACLRREG